mmetsp:Transcript_330/g.1001  ORF Transcript_330/g.1001 Transcript_330/m.1001 type:complete len:395 (-) Transcript_330:303-1487(-)
MRAVVVVVWLPAVSLGLASSAVRRLLLQRAVQTQVVYLTEFHDEMKAKWLAQFLSPCAPLGTVRLSQRECKPEYHGLDALTEWHGEHYLATMLGSEPTSFEVRYRVGQADMVDSPVSGEGIDAEAARAAMEMWGDDVGLRAARSRRQNPYLRESEPRYIEYNETIVPSRVAQLLMRTREQIALEWQTDLRSIGVGEADRYLSCLDDEPCDAVDAYSDEGLETAYGLTVRAAPIRASFEDGVNSPLRTPSLDLCDRLATREAAADALHSLGAAEADWLRAKLQLEDDDEPDESTGDPLLDGLRAAACRLVSLDALSGHARRKGLAIRWLRDLEHSEDTPADVDPLYVASVVREKRVAFAKDWADDILDYVRADDRRLLQQSLEAQLTAALPDADS